MKSLNHFHLTYLKPNRFGEKITSDFFSKQEILKFNLYMLKEIIKLSVWGFSGIMGNYVNLDMSGPNKLKDRTY